MISIIVAYTRNFAIGKDNRLLFHVSADLKRFRQLTTGHTVVMGRKTFESLPKGALPDRRNIVISHSCPQYDNVETVHSLDEALNLASGSDIYIIGGGSIYREAFNVAERLCVTEFDAVVEDADTFFPEVKSDEWNVVSESEWFTDEKNNVRFRFVDYVRK